MFKTIKELQEQVKGLEAQLEESATLIETLRGEAEKVPSGESKIAELSASIETLQGDLDVKTSDLEAMKKSLEDKDVEIVELAKSKDVEIKKATDSIETKAKDKTVEILAKAGGDVSLVESGNIDEATADFEAQFHAARKAGGIEHSRFVRDNREQIAEYRLAKG